MSTASALLAGGSSLSRSRADFMSPGTFRSHDPGLYNRPKSLASINGWIVNSMPLSANGATNCARRYRVAAASVGYDAKARTFIGRYTDDDRQEGSASNFTSYSPKRFRTSGHSAALRPSAHQTSVQLLLEFAGESAPDTRPSRQSGRMP